MSPLTFLKLDHANFLPFSFPASTVFPFKTDTRVNKNRNDEDNQLTAQGPMRAVGSQGLLRRGFQDRRW